VMSGSYMNKQNPAIAISYSQPPDDSIL